MQMPFRKMEAKQAIEVIGIEVVYCASTYLGVAKDRNDKEVILECAKFVKDKFPMLGSGELKEAFSLAAAGLLGDLNLRAYFGRLNVVMVGELLDAYLTYRRAQIAKLEAAKEEAAKEVAEKHEAYKKEQGIKQALDDIKNALSGRVKYESWRKVPHFWAELAIKEGLISPTPEEKKAVWEQSLEIAMEDLKAERSQLLENGRAREAITQNYIIMNIEKGEESAKEKLRAAATVIYCKLIIFTFLK